MEKLNKPSEFSLIFKYALKDLSRNYHKISSIIVTLFISLFILSAIFTIEDSLKKELNDNAKALLGGDLEIDYNRNQGNLDLVNKVKEFATVSQMIEFSTMLSTTGREKNKSLFTRIKTVDEKYPLYGNVVYEPIGAYERMQKEPYSILINESLSKTLNIKINEKVKVQDQNFTVIGIIKSVPDVSGFAGIITLDASAAIAPPERSIARLCAITTWPVFFMSVPTVVPVVFLIVPANIGPENVVFAIIISS